MIKIVRMSRELGYLNVDEDMFVGFDELKKLRDNQMVILTTGSQGNNVQPCAHGNRAACEAQRQEGDLVIISTSPIPGNGTLRIGCY